MLLRYIILSTFIFSILILLHREKVNHSDPIHHPPQNIKHTYNESLKTGYTLGPYANHPKNNIGILQKLGYKKVNNYAFVEYNLYKVEFAFIDFGHTSVLHFNLFTEGTHVHLEENLGFTLADDNFLGMNFIFSKNNLNFTVKQFVDQKQQLTYTVFNFSVKRPECKAEANLTHIMRNEQCFTLTRNPNIISHKCYGGIGQGKAAVQYIDQLENKKKFSVYHMTSNLTRVVFDGLRGSGSHWQWVWAMGSGFNKKQFYAQNLTIGKDRWIGINFGQLYGQQQNFLFWSGQILPINDLHYEINEAFEIKSNITFTSSEPKFQLVFTVFHKQVVYKDLIIAKANLIKAEGYWSGWIEIDGEKQQFSWVAGLVETCNSLF